MRQVWRVVRRAPLVNGGLRGIPPKVHEAMRRFILLAFVLTSCAMAQETTDDGIVMTPAEHRALAKKMVDMQDQIDDLTEQLSKAKEKFNVGHNCS
jgi:hypothetical protein